MNEKKARNLCSQYQGFQQHFGGSNWNDTTSRFQSNGEKIQTYIFTSCLTRKHLGLLYFLTSIQEDPNVFKKNPASVPKH